ncbi:unnamed protein product [Dicrocoelium dendriticum]|nr:unnamed protein product [Dicrocoelium dendriticum]
MTTVGPRLVIKMDNITTQFANSSVDTENPPPSAECISLVLNIVIPILSVLVFVGTVIVTYFVDDPGLRKLKRSSQQPEEIVVSDSDNNYVRYLPEQKLQNQVKGHTFSSFSAQYNVSTITGADSSEIRKPLAYPRRRACSESNPDRRVSDASSETQVILEHMLLPLGSGSTHSSMRTRPVFHVSLPQRWTKRFGKESENVVSKENQDESGQPSECHLQGT